MEEMICVAVVQGLGYPQPATYIDYFHRQKLHEVEHRKIRFAYYSYMALRISSSHRPFDSTSERYLHPLFFPRLLFAL